MTTDLQLEWQVVVWDERVQVNKLDRVIEPVLRSIELHIPGMPFPAPEKQALWSDVPRRQSGCP
jgi:hypothetical protein